MRSLTVLSTATLLALATVPGAAIDDSTIDPQQQKEAFNTTEIPRATLPWGMVNFLHTTDTHGWLDGHANVPSWGADWGDFVSFVMHMKDKALKKKVDLLLIDSGALFSVPVGFVLRRISNAKVVTFSFQETSMTVVASVTVQAQKEPSQTVYLRTLTTIS